MSLFVISDLHLSFSVEKPMNIFGENWEKHEEKIRKDWGKKVTENDLVLLPGDFSWAMTLEEAKADFQYLDNLKGRKILLKGNHDYWWESSKKLQEFTAANKFQNIAFLQNNAFLYEDYIICGTRGWEAKDNVYQRELQRLKLSIEDGIKKFGRDKEIICMMHYPPFYGEFTKVLKEYHVSKCFYGHLHAHALKKAKEGMIDNIAYKLVSADKLDFKLLQIT